MYALNIEYIKKITKKKGFTGIKPLLKQLGFHRNALDRFIKGAPVLPKSIETIFSTLEIPLEKGIMKIGDENYLPIEALVSKIHIQFPNISIFLFGSRAKGKARKYSDYDIGLYSDKEISLSEYLKILEIKEQYEESSPTMIDCVNLTKADKSFISTIASNIKLLAGYQRDYIKLKKIAYEQ